MRELWRVNDMELQTKGPILTIPNCAMAMAGTAAVLGLSPLSSYVLPEQYVSDSIRSSAHVTSVQLPAVPTEMGSLQPGAVVVLPRRGELPAKAQLRDGRPRGESLETMVLALRDDLRRLLGAEEHVVVWRGKPTLQANAD